MARVFAGERTFLDPVLTPVERLDLSAVRCPPGNGADVGGIHDFYVGSLASSECCRCTYTASTVFPAAQSAGICWSRTRTCIQYRGKLYDQYQLAGLLRRIHHELPDSDGGSRLPQLCIGRRGFGDSDRRHSCICSARLPYHWKFLVRSGSRDAVGVDPNLHSFHSGSDLAGCA